MTKIDPRFRRESKKNSKVVLDSRFKGMFTDKDFTSPIPLDKYGRKIDSNEEKENLERFYQLNEDSDASDASSNSIDHSLQKSSPSLSSSSSEQNTDDDSDEERDTDTHAMEDILSSHPLVNENIPEGLPTNRLAVMNLDWDAIRADDLFTLVSAFKPQIGHIESCQIFPSSFGKERMLRESMEGPAHEIFTKNNSDNNGEDYNSESLRKYQFERMRYYYAVIVCDSVETAIAIYRSCDGNEFERSANYLDFRYIPSELTFSPITDGPVHSECFSLPENYIPKHSLVTEALQSSKVSLTWDTDDQHRKSALKLGNSKVKASSAEVDLSAYLASSSSSDDDNDIVGGGGSSLSEDDVTSSKATRDEYRKKLLSNPKTNIFERPSRAGAEDEDGDMEITFKGAFDNQTSSSEEEEDGGSGGGDNQNHDPTPFTKYLTRREEKSKKEKVPEKVVSKQPTKKDKRLKRKEKEREERDLSLLVDDDEHEKNIANLVFNAKDPRFEAIYEDSSYALDPSDPSFRRTGGMEEMIKERQKRKKFTENQS